MEVKVLSKKLVKPSTPTPQDQCNFRISFFDQLMFPNYSHVILYYAANSNDCAANDIERRNNLEKSLSEILTFYYPLAGTFQGSDLSVDCNANGVEFLEAKVSCKLSQVLNGDFDMEQLNDLVPTQFESVSSPLLLAQFNMFECGGIAIGVSLSHRLADAFTLIAFVNGWAAACREGKSSVPCPNFDLPSLFPAISTRPAWPTWESEGKLVTNGFVFSGAAIRNLKEIANNAGDSATRLLECQFTRVEVVTALIWKALITVAEAICGQSRPSLAYLPINMRQRITIPIADNSCGNLCAAAIVEFVPDNQSKVQLHDLACEIHSSLSSCVMNITKASNADDVYLMMDRTFKICDSFLREGSLCSLSSWCRFPIYEADFGWGRPTWVSYARDSVDKSVVLLDSKDGEGIEAWVTLDENCMQIFQQNPDIVAFTCKESPAATTIEASSP